MTAETIVETPDLEVKKDALLADWSRLELPEPDEDNLSPEEIYQHGIVRVGLMSLRLMVLDRYFPDVYKDIKKVARLGQEASSAYNRIILSPREERYVFARARLDAMESGDGIRASYETGGDKASLEMIFKTGLLHQQKLDIFLSSMVPQHNAVI